MSSYHAHIDIYCERTEPGLWSEPLNAVTNLAFVFAAWLCWKHYAHKGPDFDRSGAFLMILVGLLGIGSGLFHTFATHWAMLADVIPIIVLIHGFLFFALRRFFDLNVWISLGAVIAFFGLATSVRVSVPVEVLNGSAGYIPPFAALTAMGAAMAIKKHPGADYMLLAAAVFAVSLTFRTIDMKFCGAIPIGTHFLWHTFNGLSLYLAGRAYLQAWRPGAI